MTLYMAWKGVGDDPRLFWSTFEGNNWSQQHGLDDRGTSTSPTLAQFNGRLYMAWKGVGDDPRLFWSTFEGNNRSQQHGLDDRGTSTSPTLTQLG
jgi:hypothetical protein